MTYTPLKALFVLLLLAGCGGTPGPRLGLQDAAAGSRTVVQGAGPDQLLKLRSGPSLEYNVILGLPDGTRLIRRRCVTELGQRWCKVALAQAPVIEGYVAADYLSRP